METSGESYAIRRVVLRLMKSLDASTRAQGGQQEVVGNFPLVTFSSRNSSCFILNIVNYFCLNIDKGHCYVFICGQLNPSPIEQHGPLIDTSVLDTCSSALSLGLKKGEQKQTAKFIGEKKNTGFKLQHPTLSVGV